MCKIYAWASIFFFGTKIDFNSILHRYVEMLLYVWLIWKTQTHIVSQSPFSEVDDVNTSTSLFVLKPGLKIIICWFGVSQWIENLLKISGFAQRASICNFDMKSFSFLTRWPRSWKWSQHSKAKGFQEIWWTTHLFQWENKNWENTSTVVSGSAIRSLIKTRPGESV